MPLAKTPSQRKKNPKGMTMLKRKHFVAQGQADAHSGKE